MVFERGGHYWQQDDRGEPMQGVRCKCAESIGDRMPSVLSRKPWSCCSDKQPWARALGLHPYRMILQPGPGLSRACLGGVGCSLPPFILSYSSFFVMILFPLIFLKNYYYFLVFSFQMYAKGIKVFLDTHSSNGNMTCITLLHERASKLCKNRKSCLHCKLILNTLLIYGPLENFPPVEGKLLPSCYTVADDKSYIVHLTNIVYVQNLSLLVIRVLLIEAVVGWYLQKSGYLSWCLNRDLKISAKAICSRSLHWLRDRIWRKAWIISILLSSWYILYSFTKADAYTCRLYIRL